MKIGDIFWCFRGIKHVVVSEFTDLEDEFIVCRFWSPRGYYTHCIEMVRFLDGDFKNDRKFKSKYLYNKYKNS